MNYLNYFSQCDKKTESSKSARIKYIVSFTIVLFAIVVAVYVIFVIKGINYKSQLNYLEGIKNNSGFIKQCEVSSQVVSLAQEAENDYNTIIEFHNASGYLNKANKKLVETIEKCMVDGSYLTRINISDGSINLNGGAEEISQISAVEKKLRETAVFKDIHINVIENADTEAESEKPEFSCRLSLIGGAIAE